jgi:endonuclease YncB( thermonuclease family)
MRRILAATFVAAASLTPGAACASSTSGQASTALQAPASPPSAPASASSAPASTATTPASRHARHAARRRAGTGATVTEIIDGDTIALANGARVRLLQIDTPELASAECYATRAKSALERMLPVGARVRLVADRALDRVDRYGRLLRYVVYRGRNLNRALVARGDAAPYFFDGDRGRLAGPLYNAAVVARRRRRGLWRSCPATQLAPTAAVATSRAAAGVTPAPSGGGSCTPGYAPCLPIRDDWDCSKLSQTYTVTGPDPYNLDGDGDGLACES